MIDLVVTEGIDGLLLVLARKKLREFLICPAVNKGVPFTPPPHRSTGRRSYHVVRLVNPHKEGTIVELLFCDQDLYLLAFRRKVTGQDWSKWHFFAEQRKLMPLFIQSQGDLEEMTKVTVTHSQNTTIPGAEYNVLEDIFFVLSNPRSGEDRVKEALLRAVILLSEMSRIKAIYDSLSELLISYKGEDEDSRIDPALLEYMRCWGKLSDCAIDNRKKVRARSTTSVDPTLLGHVNRCGVTGIDQVIGPAGQLRLNLIDEEEGSFEAYRDVPFPAGFQDRFPLPDEEAEILAGLVEDVVGGQH